jgi:hypothetical protein
MKYEIENPAKRAIFASGAGMARFADSTTQS